MSQNLLGIIDTRSLFSDLTDSLISLLKNLSPEGWNAKTCYPSWKVKDIVVHLFQTGIGRLSKQRDNFPNAEKPEPMDFSTLVDLIAQSNKDWSDNFGNNISSQLILDLIKVTEKQLSDFILTQNLMDNAYYSVVWAGETKSGNWFDLAREYTERWIHQQQIREAVGAPSITSKKYLSPVINTLVRAIPYWYETVDANEGARILIEINGNSGGNWILEKSKDHWVLSAVLTDTYDEKIRLTEDTAWRLLMRSISKEDGKDLVEFSSGNELCMKFLDVKAILMAD